MNIFRQICDADMKGNGLPPVLSTQHADLSQGYVLVDSQSCHPQHQIFKEVHIPDRKRNSYELTEKLFDNYMLNQRNNEKDSTDESQEAEKFLTMAIHSSPVKIAKQFIEDTTNNKFSDLQWFRHLHDLWFRKFNYKNGKDLSGFEHVFIGEQNGKDLVGHHFWYKYWLEENGDLNEEQKDQIDMTCATQLEEQTCTPDLITVGYHLKAFDVEKKRFIKMNKKKCTFIVGISAEGLLALGTVRSIIPVNFTVNTKSYKLELFMSPDGKSIRTFYPTEVTS